MDIYERLPNHGCSCCESIGWVCTRCLAEKELIRLKAENEKLRGVLAEAEQYLVYGGNISARNSVRHMVTAALQEGK